MPTTFQPLSGHKTICRVHNRTLIWFFCGLIWPGASGWLDAMVLPTHWSMLACSLAFDSSHSVFFASSYKKNSYTS